MKRYKDAWKSMRYFLFQMIVIGYFLCLKTPQNAPTALCSKKFFRGSMPPYPPSTSAYTQKSSRHAPEHLFYLSRHEGMLITVNMVADIASTNKEALERCCCFLPCEYHVHACTYVAGHMFWPPWWCMGYEGCWWVAWLARVRDWWGRCRADDCHLAPDKIAVTLGKTHRKRGYLLPDV